MTISMTEHTDTNKISQTCCANGNANDCIGSGVCVSLILCAWVIDRYSIDNLVMRMNLQVRRIAREDLFEDALEKLTIADEPAPKAVALST